MLGELGKPADIPGQVLPQRRMKKSLQRPIEARKRVADIFEDRARRRSRGKQPPRQESDQTGGVLDAVHADDVAGILAERARENARNRQRRVLLRQMPQHAHLAIDRLGPRLSIDDLEHVPAAVRGAQVKVAVALAGQRTHRSEEPVGVSQDALGLRSREYRRRSPKG